MKTKLVPPAEAEGMISHALSVKFSPPAWAYLEQVPDGTGGYKSRTADGIAMCLWPSRGLEILGFEIKVFRNDWLRELKTPEKAEAVARYCDRWFVVTTPDVAKKEEVPAGWGLMVLNGGKLWTKKEAPLRKGKKIDRAFMASIFRQVHEAHSENSVPKGQVQPRIDAARKEGEAEGKRKAESGLWGYERLKEAVATFEEKSGVKIESWGGGDIGDAVRFVREMGTKRIFRSIKSARAILAELLIDMDRKTIKAAEKFAEEDEGGEAG